MKYFIIIALFILICATCIFAQTNLPVGTIRRPIITDNSGNVISTNIVFSNQVVMVAAPSLSNHLARLQDLTNSFATNSVISLSLTNGYTQVPWLSVTNGQRTINVITNANKVPVANGGIGTNTTMLSGSWTNTINFRTTGTNDANAFSVNGFLGRTVTISNLSAVVGVTNVLVYTNGFLHNNFTIP